MLDERRNYLVVGIFTTAMLLALVGWLALLSGRSGASDAYWVHYANVMGLSEGTQVLFEGYRVGRLEGIRPLPPSEGGGFRIDLALEKDWPVPADSTAHVTTGGLLSAVVINIRSGTSPRALSTGSEIRGVEAANLVTALASVAGQVSGLTDELRPVFSEMARDFPAILSDLRSLSSKLDTSATTLAGVLSEENASYVREILRELESSAAGIGATRTRVDELIAAVNQVVSENRPDVRASTAELRESLEAVSSRIGAISRNLEVTLRNMNEFSDDVRRNPGVLLRGRAAELDPEASR